MKLVPAALAFALCSFGYSQTVDEVRGFREFEFGSGIAGKALVRAPMFADGYPDEATAEIDVSKFQEPMLWGRKIDRVILTYWNDQLYWVQIHLAPAAVKSTSVAAEIVESVELLGRLRDAYGEPSNKESDSRKGRLFWEWKGQAKALSFHASRMLEDKNTATVNFHVSIMSLSLLETRNVTRRSAAKIAAEKRKDGL